MTDRERFHRLMQGELVDRPPLMEEGVREEVLTAWHEQGLPPNQTHLDVFGLTPHENIGPNLRFKSSYFGRIMDLSPRGYHKAFKVSRRRFPRDWRATARRLKNREHIVCIWASRGFFQALGVVDWPTFERALLGTVEHHDQIVEFMRIYGDFCASMLEMTLEDVDPDFIYLSEPISNNDGPLISPSMFAEYMIPVYRRIVETATRKGCHKILVSTYGNTRLLFPAMFDAGVTMLWISEAAEIPELDYRELRSKFGGDVGLIGGIPLSILRRGSGKAIRVALQDIATPLLQSGRYVPLAGGRIREEIPWAVYSHYREALAAVIGAAHSG